MYECPHCGEPIEEDAEVCRHCGSDAETGWNPEAEYLSLDLPDEDADWRENSIPPRARRNDRMPLPSVVLLAGAFLFFLCAGFRSYGWGALLPLTFLGLCALGFSALVRPKTS